MIVYYIIYINQSDKPGKKTTLLLPVSALNTILHNQVVPKTVVEKCSYSELKTEKVFFFIQRSTKIVCISVFNVGSCLVSCLTFRPFFTLDPKQLRCL